MAIKPLEKKNIKGLFPKLLFLAILLSGGLLANVFASQNSQRSLFTKKPSSVLGIEKTKSSNDIVNDFVKQTEKTTSEVLGAATQIVTDTASKSASIVTDFVFDNTFGKIIEQIKVLPKEQQERIKKEICK